MRSVVFLAELLAILFTTEAAKGSPPPPPPPGCHTPLSHQWDFWLGKWEVRAKGADKIVAHSQIEKKYGECAIRENWMPVGQEVRGGGGSLTVYDSRLNEWRQTWVDSSGARVQLDGALANGVMAITGNWPDFAGPGKDALVRMKYQKQPDGEVRQWGESSTDNGKTWQPSFDFLYRAVTAFPPFE
jgi:hypothetical protein